MATKPPWREIRASQNYEAKKPNCALDIQKNAPRIPQSIFCKNKTIKNYPNKSVDLQASFCYLHEADNKAVDERQRAAIEWSDLLHAVSTFKGKHRIQVSASTSDIWARSQNTLWNPISFTVTGRTIGGKFFSHLETACSKQYRLDSRKVQPVFRDAEFSQPGTLPCLNGIRRTRLLERSNDRFVTLGLFLACPSSGIGGYQHDNVTRSNCLKKFTFESLNMHRPQKLKRSTSGTLLSVTKSHSLDLFTLCALGNDVDYLPMAIPKALNSFGDPLQLDEPDSQVEQLE